jgi:hypothetical protein
MSQKPKPQLTQQDIDALLNEDDSDAEEHEPKDKPEDEYGEEF